MALKKLSVTVPDKLLEQIELRGDNKSAVVSRDLDRLYSLYKRALLQVGLTVDEACFIADMLNGVVTTADTARLLWAGAQDAIELDKLDEKWNVDGPALVEKLRNLNEIQAMAVIDAAERFWQKREHEDMREDIRECFLIKE